jgi:hypothetical protein
MNLCVQKYWPSYPCPVRPFAGRPIPSARGAGLIDMKEVKLYDLLDLVITSNFDVGSIPNCDLELSARHSADRRKRV